MEASPAMLLKTDVEKMSVYGLSTMFMKINHLGLLRHDVYDNKGIYLIRQ
jgi:hypothetical protein